MSSPPVAQGFAACVRQLAVAPARPRLCRAHLQQHILAMALRCTTKRPPARRRQRTGQRWCRPPIQMVQSSSTRATPTRRTTEGGGRAARSTAACLRTGLDCDESCSRVAVVPLSRAFTGVSAALCISPRAQQGARRPDTRTQIIHKHQINNLSSCTFSDLVHTTMKQRVVVVVVGIRCAARGVYPAQHGAARVGTPRMQHSVGWDGFGKGPFRFYENFVVYVAIPEKDEQYPEMFECSLTVATRWRSSVLWALPSRRWSGGQPKGVVVVILVEGSNAEAWARSKKGDVLIAVTAVKVFGARVRAQTATSAGLGFRHDHGSDRLERAQVAVQKRGAPILRPSRRTRRR